MDMVVAVTLPVVLERAMSSMCPEGHTQSPANLFASRFTEGQEITGMNFNNRLSLMPG